MEHLDFIRNFSLNLKTYKDYVNYFYKLDLDTQTDIIAMMIDYKKYNYLHIKNGNLDKIYNMYKILLHKLEYNELNIKERDIYENIISYLIIDDEFDNDKLFRLYCDKYLKNMNRHNFNRRIFLIMQDVLNILNECYNKNIKLLLTDSIDFAAVNWFDIEYKNRILLNLDKYKDYFYSNEVNELNIINTVIYQIFVICHEFEHVIQRDYMYENDNNLAISYKNDIHMIAIFNKFYNDYHDNFYIENEATNYGLLSAINYIKKYFYNTILIKDELNKSLLKSADLNIKNKKEYLIKYKIYLLIIKMFKIFNIETPRMKEVDNLYKEMKKRFNSSNN